jgi:hypothetical protein
VQSLRKSLIISGASEENRTPVSIQHTQDATHSPMFSGSSLFSVGEHVQVRPGGFIRKLAGGANPELSTQLF